MNDLLPSGIDALSNIYEALIKAGVSGHEKMESVGLTTFFILLVVSFFASLYISRLYVRFYRPRGTGSLAYRSFPCWESPSQPSSSACSFPCPCPSVSSAPCPLSASARPSRNRKKSDSSC